MQDVTVARRSRSTGTPPNFELLERPTTRRPSNIEARRMLGLMELGQDFWMTSPRCDRLTDVTFEVSTHADYNMPYNKGSLNITEDGIEFVRDITDFEESVPAFGPCVGNSLQQGDIISAQILPLDDVKTKLEVSLAQSSIPRRRGFQTFSLTHSFPASNPAAFHRLAALELALPRLWNPEPSQFGSHLSFCLQFLCRCPRPTCQGARPRSSSLSRPLRRNRSHGLRHHGFACLLVLKEDSLKLYRRLMAWMRLRCIDWNGFSERLLQTNDAVISQTLNLSLSNFDDPGEVSRRFSMLTASQEELLLPELEVGFLPSVPLSERVPNPQVKDILCPAITRWLCCGRIPEADTLSPSWRLNYSTQRHGSSFFTLLDRMAKFRGNRAGGNQSPSLLLCEDEDGRRYGALLSHIPHRSFVSYGIPDETILFRFKPNLEESEVFKCKPEFPDQIHTYLDRRMLSIGNSNGAMGLTIQDDMKVATMEPCSTFSGLEEESLAGTSEFCRVNLAVVEVWAIHPAHL